MSVQAILNMALNLSGGTSGPEQIVIPPLVASNALDVRVNYQFPSGITSLSAILGSGVCLPMATGMLIFAATGTTPANLGFGASAASLATTVGALPNPIFLSAGISVTAQGVSLSAATTATIILF